MPQYFENSPRATFINCASVLACIVWRAFSGFWRAGCSSELRHSRVRQHLAFENVFLYKVWEDSLKTGSYFPVVLNIHVYLHKYSWPTTKAVLVSNVIRSLSGRGTQLPWISINDKIMICLSLRGPIAVGGRATQISTRWISVHI
jgi:hypothetical protein